MSEFSNAIALHLLRLTACVNELFVYLQPFRENRVWEAPASRTPTFIFHWPSEGGFYFINRLFNHPFLIVVVLTHFIVG